MKIKFLAEDDLNFIKSNLYNAVKDIVINKRKSLEEFLGNDMALRDTAYDISDFALDMSQPQGKESLTDIENIKRVYNNMKSLTDSQASDERIWAAYTLSIFLDYMRYRWPAKSEKDLKNNYLFGYSHQRSLFRNGIARLWWIGRFTYDEKRGNPYELTEFLCRDMDYIESLCGRNIFNNPGVGMSTVKALFDADNAGVKINRDIVRNVAKYINLLAGAYLLESLDQDEVYRKVCKKVGYN